MEQYLDGEDIARPCQRSKERRQDEPNNLHELRRMGRRSRRQRIQTRVRHFSDARAGLVDRASDLDRRAVRPRRRCSRRTLEYRDRSRH